MYKKFFGLKNLFSLFLFLCLNKSSCLPAYNFHGGAYALALDQLIRLYEDTYNNRFFFQDLFAEENDDECTFLCAVEERPEAFFNRLQTALIALFARQQFDVASRLMQIGFKPFLYTDNFYLITTYTRSYPKKRINKFFIKMFMNIFFDYKKYCCAADRYQLKNSYTHFKNHVLVVSFNNEYVSCSLGEIIN